MQDSEEKSDRTVTGPDRGHSPTDQPVTPSAPVDPAAGIDRDNWQDPDNVRWSFQNVARVLPTTPISRGTGPVAELPADPQDLGEVEVPATEYSEARSVRSVIDSTDTDAWMLMHNGTVLTEEYFGR